VHRGDAAKDFVPDIIRQIERVLVLVQLDTALPVLERVFGDPFDDGAQQVSHRASP